MNAKAFCNRAPGFTPPQTPADFVGNFWGNLCGAVSAPFLFKTQRINIWASVFAKNMRPTFAACVVA